MYHTKDDNTGIVNPLAMIDKDANGYQSLISRWFQSAFSLRWDMPFLPGLYAKGFFSYDYIMNDNKFYRKAFNTYTSTGAATSFLKGDAHDYFVQRNYYGKEHRQWHVQVGYDRTFGRHSVSGMLLFEDQHKVGDNFYGSREVVLPMDQVFVGDGETQQFNQSSGGGSLYDYAYQSLQLRLRRQVPRRIRLPLRRIVALPVGRPALGLLPLGIRRMAYFGGKLLERVFARLHRESENPCIVR